MIKIPLVVFFLSQMRGPEFKLPAGSSRPFGLMCRGTSILWNHIVKPKGRFCLFFNNKKTNQCLHPKSFITWIYQSTLRSRVQNSIYLLWVCRPSCMLLKCHRWAQVTRFLVIAHHELNWTHREFIAERERTDLLSDSILHRTWERAKAKQRLTLHG